MHWQQLDKPTAALLDQRFFHPFKHQPQRRQRREHETRLMLFSIGQTAQLILRPS